MSSTATSSNAPHCCPTEDDTLTAQRCWGARMGTYKSQIFFCLNIAFALLAIVLLALYMVDVEAALTGSQMMPLKVIEAPARR